MLNLGTLTSLFVKVESAVGMALSGGLNSTFIIATALSGQVASTKIQTNIHRKLITKIKKSVDYREVEQYSLEEEFERKTEMLRKTPESQITFAGIEIQNDSSLIEPINKIKGKIELAHIENTLIAQKDISGKPARSQTNKRRTYSSLAALSRLALPQVAVASPIDELNPNDDSTSSSRNEKDKIETELSIRGNLKSTIEVVEDDSVSSSSVSSKNEVSPEVAETVELTQFKNYNESQGLAHKNISSIAKDGSVVYIGTSQGLSITNDNFLTFLNLTEANGLIDKDIIPNT